MLLIAYKYEAIVKTEDGSQTISHLKDRIVMAQNATEAEQLVAGYVANRYAPRKVTAHIIVEDTLIPGYATGEALPIHQTTVFPPVAVPPPNPVGMGILGAVAGSHVGYAGDPNIYAVDQQGAIHTATVPITAAPQLPDNFADVVRQRLEGAALFANAPAPVMGLPDGFEVDTAISDFTAQLASLTALSGQPTPPVVPEASAPAVETTHSITT